MAGITVSNHNAIFNYLFSVFEHNIYLHRTYLSGRNGELLLDRREGDRGHGARGTRVAADQDPVRAHTCYGGQEVCRRPVDN